MRITLTISFVHQMYRDYCKQSSLALGPLTYIDKVLVNLLRPYGVTPVGGRNRLEFEVVSDIHFTKFLSVYPDSCTVD